MEMIRDQFFQPPEEYTPIPFWFWNDRLTEAEIIRQIHDFYDKGVTGFVLHPRIGIPKDIGYLSDRFMELVYAAVKEASALGMTVILYDEGMYPSGAANGQVVKENRKYASRGLKMVEYPCHPSGMEITVQLSADEELVSVQAVEKRTDSSIHPDSTRVLVNNENKLVFTPPTEQTWSLLLFIETYTKGTIRGIHYGEDDGEAQAPPAADLLNPAAVNTYIRLTHEKYFAALKAFFGKTIIAMFTDEPDLAGRNSLPDLMPWTGDFLTYYKRAENKETWLPALWFDAGKDTAEIRRRYRKTVKRKLGESYYKPISTWCEQRHIALAGHPADSDDIGLLEYFQLPGQDIVWRWVGPEEGKALAGRHSTAAKCSADAARHRGRRRNLNEVLGVCGKESNWALHPSDMKWYFDWLFVRGVNLIVPHAFYYSVSGKRSRERPPDVGPNNSWWPYYRHFSQYIKRMSWLMTDCVNLTVIAVLCETDQLPWKTVKPFYENQIEFNYLEQALLSGRARIAGDVIQIAGQVYNIVVIEDTVHLEERTIKKLTDFMLAGGTVITVGEQAEEQQQLMRKGAIPLASEAALVDVLNGISERQIVITPQDTDIRASKIQKAGCIFYIIVNEGEKKYEGSLQVKEKGKIEEWDPWKSTIRDASSVQHKHYRTVPVDLNRREALIYCIDPGQQQTHIEAAAPQANTRIMTTLDKWSIGHPATPVDNTLRSWTEWEGMEYYSGTIVYETAFEVGEADIATAIVLDLGEVHEIADVSINGQEIGVKMWAPYRFTLERHHLKPRNRLRITVTNSLANQMDRLPLKSGLLGPVTLEVVAL
ncbi:alpha-L-rhamnosidase [Evansella caseinilytica]|uniref:Alpha-L-rhamnosidase n=1 Tax=Evansella caseinilytica TaxID=1503961 RepID=A0A1H3GJI6_9BACI|nr:glycosyl hydrolase [Evansella caseinilytica]SDY03441.1 alpha-L-rhamnosidase [Evansella caseinilytica]